MKSPRFTRHLRNLPGLFLLAPVLCFSATHTVTTADNASGPADGQTSLLEALALAQDGDTIAFNIPGDGPHYIKTPSGGYPLMQRNQLTIDGYSQPGSQKNSASLHENNNASLKIVIDSRDGGRLALTEYGDNGFGDTESAIFPLYFAKDVAIRGLAFIGVTGNDTPADPHVYNIALIGESTGLKVQGCWFGLDPAAAPFTANAQGKIPGVHGARAAIAGFPWESEMYSSGLVVGTDGDGNNDREEFNIFVGNLLAVHVQTPDVRISGNRVNYLPDGRPWDNVIQQATTSPIAIYENGAGHDNIIGTNGDGISDENEGNYFGPVTATSYLEFWRPAMNVIIAGNYIGVTPSGGTFTTPASVRLIDVRDNSSFRIGSNLDGKSDNLEANHLANFQSPIVKFNRDTSSDYCHITFRGNITRNLFGDLPVHSRKLALADPEEDPWEPHFLKVYSYLLEFPSDPFSLPVRPVIGNDSTLALIKGSVPSAYEAGVAIDVDFYLADPQSLSYTDAINPDGFPQGLTYLSTQRVDGPNDTDAAPNAFAFANLPGVTADNIGQLICMATYTVSGDFGYQQSSIFSFPPAITNAPAQPIAISVATDSATGDLILTWTGGGQGGFTVEHSTTLLEDSWRELMTTGQRTVTIPRNGAFHYYRIKDGVTLAQ